MSTRKSVLFTALTTLCFTSLNIGLCADQAMQEKSCITEVKPYQIGVRHIESNGVGYNQGYTTLEGLFTVPKSLETCLVPFLDLRGHAFNNGKFAANAGLGLRLVNSRVWGINSYYDYRKTERFHYNQVSVGLESLGKVWDFRINGYLPVGKKHTSLYHAKFHEFEGNHMILRLKREFAMKGLNAEAGVHINMPKGMNCYLAAGPYYFEGNGKNAIGGEARARIMLHKYVGISVNGSYDPVFHGIVQGEARLTFPFGPKEHTVKKIGRSCANTQAVRALAMQPIDRNEIIVVDKKHKYRTAINQETGAPFFFLFVDNTSSSNGTFESPFHTLLDAQNTSNPHDIIYVFPGDGTNKGMNSGIHLKNSQQLLGAGFPYAFQTQFGTITAPAQASGRPLLGNSTPGATIVELADHNYVAGFQITQVNQRAMNAEATAMYTGLTIDNNIILGSDSDGSLRLIGAGNLRITNNVINNTSGTQNIRIAVNAAATMNATIEGNLINGGSFGLGLNFGTGCQVNFMIANNTITNRTNNSIFIGPTGGALHSSNITIVNNTISGVTASNGMFWQLGGPGCLTVKNNHFSNIAGSGILIAPIAGTNLFADIENNTISANSSALNLSASASSTSCLRLLNNTSTQNYVISASGAAHINLEPPVGNTGTVSTSGTTAVAADSCNCSN